GGFGQRYVEEITDLLSNGEFEPAHDMITRAGNRLRGTTVPDTGEEDLSEDERAELRDRQGTRPRFEVLIVDETTEGCRDDRRPGPPRLRTSSGQFIYAYVRVPTAHDAVAAGLTNPTLLACVLRPGFPDETRAILSRALPGAVEFAHLSAKEWPTGLM